MAARFGARAALGMGAVAALLAALGGGLALRRIRNEERADRLRAAEAQDAELRGEDAANVIAGDAALR